MASACASQGSGLGLRCSLMQVSYMTTWFWGPGLIKWAPENCLGGKVIGVLPTTSPSMGVSFGQEEYRPNMVSSVSHNGMELTWTIILLTPICRVQYVRVYMWGSICEGLTNHVYDSAWGNICLQLTIDNILASLSLTMGSLTELWSLCHELRFS